MEVDKILYIFGSFTRKKQDRRKSLDQSSISAGNSPLHCQRRPTSQACQGRCQNLPIAPRTSAYDDARKSQVFKAWECRLCRKELVEPRLLGCLHSFCTRCLQGLHQEGETEVWSEIDGGSIHLDPEESGSGSATGSAGSGYESDLRHSGSEGSWDQKPHKYGIYCRKVSGKSVQFLLCPTCGYETPLPLGGIAALPLNYVLLRKMAATGREERASVLCDLCTCDNKAESRCNICSVSICASCGEAHGRQKATARHSLLPLDTSSPKFCSQHPRAELCVYCATCQQVICRDCCVISHCGHALANASRAAAERARLLKDACERARRVPQNVEYAARNLNVVAMETENEATRIESDIQSWGAAYRRSVEAHTRALSVGAAGARARQRAGLARQHRQLAARAASAREAAAFTDELLSEAKDEEILSLSGPVLRRLEKLSDIQSLAEPPKCELRFAPTAPVGSDSMLFGRLLTRAPDSEKCVLNVEGLQDLLVDCPHEAVLELRDSNGERIWCGAEQVSGYFRRSDSSARPTTAQVTDRGDGTYGITIKSSAPGAYLLAVTLNNKPIKGSPFACAVRVSKTHSGQFHCCAFCSSGGRRDATCGCGATMGGGYKGCGHGHAGWPGGRHWSCCGSTKKNGPCERPGRVKSQLYQFSL